ncbi:ketoacyl-ACP synthase III [Micrococcales bacterium 31B]|nr:ketoacyl-ACP synthase III [Micrococcales bacterium 31B]
MVGSKVVAAGHYQPEKVLTNFDLEKIVETNDEWIRTRVGIQERRIVAEGDGNTMEHMASEAAKMALESIDLAASEIDMIVVATCTAVDRSPNIAARVANILGIKAPAAIDINVACSGFSHAVAIADHAIQVGASKNALVIGAERLTDWVDWKDRTTSILVADGAGCFVLQASEESGVSPVTWGSVPEMGDAVLIEGRNGPFAQSGQSVFRWTTSALPKIAAQTCERAGVKPEDLGGVVLHQANLRIIEPLAAKLGAVNAVVAKDIVTSGNTSAASIPMAFSKLIREGAIESGKPVLLFGFGGGLAYAGQVVTFP